MSEAVYPPLVPGVLTVSSAYRRSKLFGLVLTVAAVTVISAAPASAGDVEWFCVGGPTPHPICVEV